VTGPLALSAALLALYGTAHCAAMCGGFVASAFTGPGGPRSPLAALPMHAGRLASYATAGAIAGAIGATPAVLLGSNWHRMASSAQPVGASSVTV